MDVCLKQGETFGSTEFGVQNGRAHRCRGRGGTMVTDHIGAEAVAVP